MTNTLPLTALVTILALLVYAWTSVRVGAARTRFKVAAPAISGDPQFERIHRAQVNTTEQLVLFLPALWLFAWQFGDLAAAVIGVCWPIARVIYAIGYAQAAERRHLGFAIGSLSGTVLLLGALYGIVRDLLG
ncbi:MAG: MAPEG family protein [Gammaproteobacteria bacterium]|nr:MAPEG family protein [Gammaproteobacteria bacterium]